MSDPIFAPSVLEAADQKMLPQNKPRGAIYLIKTYDLSTKKPQWYVTSKPNLTQVSHLTASDTVPLTQEQVDLLNQNPSWTTVDSFGTKSSEFLLPWFRIINIENINKRK